MNGARGMEYSLTAIPRNLEVVNGHCRGPDQQCPAN